MHIRPWFLGIAVGVTAAGGAPLLAQSLQLAEPACYDGVIGTGAAARRVVVEHVQSGATVHLFTRPARSLPLKPADGSLDRYVSEDGQGSVELMSIDGAPAARVTLTRGSGTSTVNVPRVVAPAHDAGVEGEWHAAIGPGGVIRLIARVQRGPCGLLGGVFDSPDQGQRDLPMTAARIVGDSVVAEAAYMGLRITLPRGAADERRGTMTQNAVVSEILMRRGAESPPLNRPQEPQRPYPYVEREVHFPSRSPGVAIAGTLTLPPAAGPHPAIVLISGSGAQDRDETIAGHKPFLVLSDYLTRLGYAVLRTDDRGVGGSTGNVMRSGLHDIADDVRGAVDYLRATPAVDPARIGLLGHSEGGYVAPIVAAADSSIAFIMLLGSPAVSGRDVFMAQRSALTRAGGAAAPVVRVDSLLSATLFAVLDTRPPDDALHGAVDSALNAWLRGLPRAERTVGDSLLSARTSTQDSMSMEFWKSPWFKSLYHHQPGDYLHVVGVPVFALLGELDLQVPPAQSAPVFESLFAKDRRHLLTVARVPGVNHMLQPARRGTMDEYMTIEQTVASDVLTRIAEWLARVAPPGR